jgi:uncharacterized protein (DUF2342 family)
MRRMSLSLLVTLVLFVFLLTPAPSNAAGEEHPMIRRAINALHAAKTDLQNAAHDYCGHRVEALEATNNALSQLQAALDCAARHDRAAGPDPEIAPESAGSPAPERHPNINKAISSLEAAEEDLQNASRDYCGHRVQALESTRAALNRLRLAIECDKK